MKYLEDQLQMNVATYLNFKKVLWCHVGNERKTSPQAGKRMKLKGVKSGVPDCLIFTSKGNFKGLALELKITKENGIKKNGEPRKLTKGKLSSNQKEWLLNLAVEGWECKVAYSFDEAKIIIDNYLKN